ncbi:MAG: aminotransferase class III-fold pyridoxal phosphate-dependent enzyme [Nitrospinota bacterium]
MKSEGLHRTAGDTLPHNWRDRAEIRLSTEPPGPAARRWIDHHLRFAAPSTYLYPFVWDVTAPAEGPFCTDPDGNLFLDFYGHVGAAPLGYNHPEILRDCGVPFDPVKAADHDTYLAAGPDPRRPAALPAPPASPARGGPAGFLTPGHLQERLAGTVRPFGHDRVFLVNSGAEANENAFKIAVYRKHREVRSNLGEGGYRDLCRQLGIRPDPYLDGLYEDYPFFGLAAHGGFHGRTLGVLSATHSRASLKEGFPALRWIRHFPFNAPRREMEALLARESLAFLLREERLARTVFQERKIPRELLAFLILEPVQGEGGYVFPEGNFPAEAAGFARAHGALFIADEVQTGVGRTGRWWACERLGVVPDLLTAAKALRVGAVTGRREVFPRESGVLSSTWAGGAVASAVGARTLGVIEEEDLLGNAARTGTVLLRGLEDLASRHPAVTGVRALGLLAAVDLECGEARDALVRAAFRRGLLILGCGDRTIRLLPPLNVREREIKMGLRVLEAALTETEGARPRPGAAVLAE